MKSFKIALLTVSIALLLPGCGDDSDSDSYQPPNINTDIVGFWNEDNANGNLSAITFMDDGTYVQVQVNDAQSTNDQDGGLEWGEYSVDKRTGKLTTTQFFDENGDMGLSGNLNYFARVSNGKLVIEVDENENGNIDSDEQFEFSEVKPKGIVGSWSFDDADDDELIGVAFLDDDQYVHVQVDSNRSVDNSENGLEWGTYAINPSTSQLTTSQTFDSNGGKGLSEPSTRYARVTDDEKLIIDVDDESFTFSRTMTNSMINPQMLSGLWRMDLGDEELVTLSFLDDGTYVQTQVTGTTSSRGADNGIEWGKYSLKDNDELVIDKIVYDANGDSGLSDDVLRTVQISGNTLTLGVDGNDNNVIENNEYYMFSKAKSENELGIWKARAGQVNDELVLVGFLDNQTFFHIEVDEKPPFEESTVPLSGMDWNLYTLGNNGLFTLGQSLYTSTGGNDLSFFYQMNVKVAGNTLTFNGYEDQMEVQNDDGETVVFDRQ